MIKSTILNTLGKQLEDQRAKVFKSKNPAGYKNLRGFMSADFARRRSIKDYKLSTPNLTFKLTCFMEINIRIVLFC